MSDGDFQRPDREEREIPKVSIEALLIALERDYANNADLGYEVRKFINKLTKTEG